MRKFGEDHNEILPIFLFVVTIICLSKPPHLLIKTHNSVNTHVSKTVPKPLPARHFFLIPVVPSNSDEIADNRFTITLKVLCCLCPWDGCFWE